MFLSTQSIHKDFFDLTWSTFILYESGHLKCTMVAVILLLPPIELLLKTEMTEKHANYYKSDPKTFRNNLFVDMVVV